MLTPGITPLHSLLSSGRNDARPVCHDGQRFVLWPEFAGKIAAQSAALKQRTETRWLLTSEDPQVFAIHLLALLYAGKQAVIPPNTQTGTLRQLADAFDAVVDAGFGGTLPPETSPHTQPPVNPDAAIIDLYTSGSTGTPKQVRKTLAQFEAEIDTLETLWGATLGNARILATAPHQHIYGLLFRLLWPLAAGRPFDAVTCAHPDTLGERLALLGQSGDTALISSPAQLSRLPALLALEALQPTPKLIFSSGGPLPATTAAEFHRQIRQAPSEIFGSTETGGIAWRRQEGQPDSDAWTPLPGVTIGRDAAGALLLHSPFLHLPLSSPRCANADPWRMDDAIDLLAGGRFRLRGRLDRIVKIEEKRLSLPDMEAQLLAHPWVSNAAAAALSGHRQSVGAVVVLTAEGEHQLAMQGKREIVQQLRKHLATHFETVLLPRRWRFLEHLPLNERGKLTQTALTALFADDEKPVAPILYPDVLAIRPGSSTDQIVLDLHVPPALAHFPGHFPGLPILPGVVQIDWAVRFAREHLPLCGEFRSLENIKFLAIVLPDAQLELVLKWDAVNARLEFSFTNSQRKYSSGRIVFGGDA